MSKRSRSKKRQKRAQPPRQRVLLPWLVAGAALLLFAGALLLARPWSGGDPKATPEVGGAPRLMIDQTTVDEGYIKYNIPVRTTFRLSNIGDQPLKILGTPQVSLVEGC